MILLKNTKEPLIIRISDATPHDPRLVVCRSSLHGTIIGAAIHQVLSGSETHNAKEVQLNCIKLT